MMSVTNGIKPEQDEHAVVLWLRQAAKGIVWIAGFGAAIATIVGWAQLANAAANPHQSSYDALKRLGTGVTVEHFDFVLGPPAAVIEIPVIASDSGSVIFEDVTERIYLQSAHIVTTLTADEHEVQQYTVLSCDPTFRPSFLTPTGSRVQLNDDPLARADTAAAEPESVYVATGGTASTPMQILDVALSAGDAQSRYRGYAYGISDLCASFASQTGGVPQDYVGTAAGLPPEAAVMRDTLPANYYVEIGMSWALLPDGVRFVVPPDESIPAEYLAEVSTAY